GRVDYRLPASRKAEAVRITRVELLQRRYCKAGDLVAAAGLERDELNRRAEGAKIDREKRRRLLGLEDVEQQSVAAVDANMVSGKIGGSEKREPHDVVPMRV